MAVYAIMGVIVILLAVLVVASIVAKAPGKRYDGQ